tara:strand:+ start:62267 stop:63079 length:813 start_codon:yes stop_codon:yes gene_type:complete
MSQSVRKHVKRAIKHRVRPLTHAWLRGHQLVDGLRRMNISGDRPLFVHSSLSSLGYIPGGIQTVLDSIRAVIGSDGNLAMPTHSWASVSQGLREFDVRKTPSCVGQITEVFRQCPGVQRSLHPTHSIAADGPGAADLVKDHERSDTPCGIDTPYHRLLVADARILFLGAPFESNTCYHCVEAISDVDYLLSPDEERFDLIREDGSRVSAMIRRHRRGIRRDLSRLKSELLNRGTMQAAMIGNTPCLLIDGRNFMNFLGEELDRDREYLLA